MIKSTKFTMISFVLAVVCWQIKGVVKRHNLELIFTMATVMLSIIFICFLAVSICAWIGKKRKKNISAYKIFAAADVCIGIVTAIYAIYDIKTDVGFMAGIVGFLLLIFVIPIVLVLLLADFIIWRLKNRKFKQKKVSADECFGNERGIKMSNIRQAKKEDALRIAEIEIFNYRLNFYPIFKNDGYYFDELQVFSQAEKYRADERLLDNTYVYDDGVVKGFIRVEGAEVEKLFVEPVLQGQSIGEKLLEYVIENKDVNFLWALEKNVKAIKFYERHGFHVTENRKLEEDTTEYLVRLEC